MRSNKKIALLCAVTALSFASLTGCSSKEADKNSTSTPAPTAVTEEADTASALKDGTYTKTATEEDNGYTYTMDMVVEGGKITSINWDATDAEGNLKSQLSLDGKYVMTETGLTWAAQSEALANHVVETQSVDGLTVDSEGKTDVVAGVSIKIGGFVEYATALMEEAAQ